MSDKSGPPSSTTSPPGLDLAAFAAFVGPSFGPPDGWRADVIAGGRSNLTYDIRNGPGSWILRRPPLGHVLETAHDMGRECRVVRALATTAVPVPRVLAFCADPAVLGAPFYVMSKVDGVPYRTADELAALGARRTEAISTSMIDVLAELHRVDPDVIGLGDFGRPAGFAKRQVGRWKRQLDASRSRDLPAADALHEVLSRCDPPEQAPAIVHGDFRLDNLLVDSYDQVAAVIDWEMATLGDPLTDVALLLVYRLLAERAPGGGLGDACGAPGFLSEEAMLDRYARASGRDLSGIAFYRALACFKLAAILEGIHFRHQRGETVGAGFEQLGELVEPVLAEGVSTLTR